MIESDKNNYYARKKAWKKKVRLKKIKALSILSCFAILIIGVFVLLFLGGKKIITLFKDKDETKYEISEASNLVLIDNENLFPIKEEDSLTASASAPVPENNDVKDDVFNNNKGKGLIIIDAGHGGYDGGTGFNSVNEKDINLSIAKWLKDELEYRGYTTYMTRVDDTFVGLNERATLANAQSEALALVSIHQNAYEDDSSVKGVEAWTYKRAGCTELGEALIKGLCDKTGAEPRNVNYKTNLVVTSKTTMPSVIIECGYMTNNEDFTGLITDEYQLKVAEGISDGIDAFISTYYDNAE